MNEEHFEEIAVRELAEQRRSTYGMVALLGAMVLVMVAIAYALRSVELTWR